MGGDSEPIRHRCSGRYKYKEWYDVFDTFSSAGGKQKLFSVTIFFIYTPTKRYKWLSIYFTLVVYTLEVGTLCIIIILNDILEFHLCLSHCLVHGGQKCCCPLQLSIFLPTTEVIRLTLKAFAKLA